MTIFEQSEQDQADAVASGHVAADDPGLAEGVRQPAAVEPAADAAAPAESDTVPDADAEDTDGADDGTPIGDSVMSPASPQP